MGGDSNVRARCGLLVLTVLAIGACEADSADDDGANTGAPTPTEDAGDVSSADAEQRDASVPATNSNSPEASVPNSSLADAGALQCFLAGESCVTGSCCPGTTCVADPSSGVTVCAAQCTQGTECMSACCAAVKGSTVGVCAPSSFCSTPSARTGCNLIANDGTFLGKASSSTVDPEGVCNSVSPYGSTFGAASIYNKFGNYGSTFSAQSAYSTITSTPPAVVCDGNVVRGYVTKNSLKQGAIDPDGLCAVLRSNGL